METETTGVAILGGGRVFVACNAHAGTLRAALHDTFGPAQLEEDYTTGPFDGGVTGYRCQFCGA